MTHTFATLTIPAHLCVSGRTQMLPAVCDAVITALPTGANIAHTRWAHGDLTVYVAAPASRWPTVQDLERGLQAARCGRCGPGPSQRLSLLAPPAPCWRGCPAPDPTPGPADGPGPAPHLWSHP